MTTQTYLTVAEIATSMRVSRMTVYRLIESGELPAVRVGTMLRVKISDMATYLKRKAYL